METPEVIEQSPEAAKPGKAPKVKDCLNCGNEFTYKLDSAQYCSGSCRATHANKRKKAGGMGESKNTAEPKSESPTQLKLNGLPAHAEYIIHHQQTVIADWRKRYEDERAELKRLKEKYKDLKEELATEKRTMELKGLEDSRPSFLDQISAFVPEEVRSKVLGVLADKVLNATTAQEGGVEGVDQNWVAIQGWYSKLGVEHQQKIFEMLNGLAMIQDPHAFNTKLTQILNLLSTFNKMRNAAN